MQLPATTPAESAILNRGLHSAAQLDVTPTFFSAPSGGAGVFMTPIFPLEDSGRLGGNKESKLLLEHKQRGIDNGSREWLLGAKLGHVALVIDALLRIWGVGQRFTFRQAQNELQAFGIGHRSLRTALTARPRGYRLFSYAGVLKPRVGRPAQLYELPSPSEVAKRLLLPRTTSDWLESKALRSTKSYRAALHREFIKRKPGEHTRRFLATRLGVSKRTTRAYDKLEQIAVTHQVTEQKLYGPMCFGMAHTPEDNQHWRWLVCDGKKFPAVYKVARKLLDDKRDVLLVTQVVNRYEYRQ